MSPSPLDLVWWSSDVVLPAFTAEEIGAWPVGAFQTLSSCGLVREWRTATHVVCGACSGGHVAEVMRLSYQDGVMRFFAACPEHGRVQVEKDQLRQWTVDFEPVLDCVARDLRTAGAVVEVVPARLWNVGVAKLAGRTRPVWVGRGLSWSDVASYADERPAGVSPVLLYLSQPLRPSVPGFRPAALIDAAQVLYLADGALVLDRTGVEEQLAARQAAKVRKAPPKRATRAAAMAALKTALRAHMIAARDHAFATLDRDQAPELLPRPTQKFLAKQLHLSRSAVCRALADGSDKELAILWEAACHLDQVMRLKDA